jgi:hypothetical protein
MHVIKKYFPEIMDDNEVVYFNHFFGMIESIDELCSMEITKKPTGIHFRIAPSSPKYNDSLLQEILKFHNVFKIKLNLSKSMKTSATITFDIDI